MATNGQFFRNHTGIDDNRPPQHGVTPIFWTEERIDGEKSAAAGYNVYYSQEMVNFRIAGDLKSEPSMKVTDRIRQQWKPQYDAWKAGREAPVDGIPLSVWHGFPPALAKTLAFHHILTVEQLAALPDGKAGNLGLGAEAWRRKAGDYLKIAKEDQAAQRLHDELVKRDDELALMKAQLQQLQTMLASRPSEEDEAPEPVRRRPGRPPKQEVA